MNIFEQAVKEKLRFSSIRGMLSVEDLWDLPLLSKSPNGTCLDDIAKTVYNDLKESETESFVVDVSEPSRELQLKMDIVKYVIDVKKGEAERAKKARVKYDQKQQILALISEKENEELRGKSLEDLRKMVNELGE